MAFEYCGKGHLLLNYDYDAASAVEVKLWSSGWISVRR